MERQTSPLGPGHAAPEFELKDQGGGAVRWTGSKGKLILLSFHPMAWTDVCARQMLALELNKVALDSLNVMPFGLSIDTVPSKKAWAEHLGIRTLPLLADFWPHGAVAQAYGLFRERSGVSERANVIVDRTGKIAFVRVYEMPQLPDLDEIMEVLKKLI